VRNIEEEVMAGVPASKQKSVESDPKSW
jgi:hypothetical protein